MDAILEMRGISKSFPGVKALRDVNLVVKAGEIHAICGENGAGKSTLMKVLSGVYPYGSYEGEIIYQGEERRFSSISRQRAPRHHHHPPGAGARAAPVHRREHLPRQRAGDVGVIDWYVAFEPHARPAEEGGAQGVAQRADHQYRRRQAAARRDRQGARQAGEAADPGRADREPERERQRRAARPAARIPEAGHHLDHHLAQAQRDRPGRRQHHHPARRHDRGDDRLPPRGRSAKARIIKSMVGREMSDRYPPRDAEDRRDAVRGEGLVGRSPAARRAARSSRASTSCPRAARSSASPG